MSIQEQIQLVQAILDNFAAEQDDSDFTESQKQELDRRIDDYEANLDNVLTWEQVKASVEKDLDTQLYVGYVPGFSGAHSQAKTLDELQENLREVIEMLLEDQKA